MAHPNDVGVPQFEALLAKSKAPFFLISCEDDFTFPPEEQKKAEEIIGGGKYAPGYERRVCHVLPLVVRNLERTLEKGIHRRHIFISPLQSRRSKVRTYRINSQKHMADTIEAVFV